MWWHRHAVVITTATGLAVLLAGAIGNILYAN